MKKFIKIFIYITMLICLLSCLCLLIFMRKEEKKCSNFEYSDVLYEINLATNGYYEDTRIEIDVSSYLPVSFDENKKYAFGNNYEEKNEYFLLVENLTKEEKETLKEFVETNIKLENDIKLEEYDKYTYIIASDSYTSIIEGIIRSFIYCD